MTGDDDDPNNEGILKIVSDTREKVEHMEDRMTEQHEELRELLEETDNT